MRPVVLLSALAAILMADTAWAGGGPWTLSPDDRSLFIGGGYTRWRHMAGGDGGDPADVGATITRSGLNGVFTYGLVHGAEVELQGGLAWAGVGPTEGELCANAANCETSLGLTPLQARVKARLIDELTAPLSVAAGLELRFGDFTRDSRHRLTALGDGQTDVGAFVAAGRSGGLGSLSYGTYAELTGRHRLLINRARGEKVPADEIAGNAEFLLFPTSNISVGPAVDALHSLGGLDLGTLEMTHPDVFTSLAVTSVKVGGKLNVRSTENVTVSISAFGTVYAKNNPADFFTIGFGLGTYTPASTGAGT